MSSIDIKHAYNTVPINKDKGFSNFCIKVKFTNLFAYQTDMFMRQENVLNY